MNSVQDQTCVQEDLIKKYKELVKHDNNENEVYKWELIKKFQLQWDINANDFPSMIKKIEFSNLIYHNSKRFINSCEKYPEKIRGMFRDLFDESKDLKKRIVNFQQNAVALFDEHIPGLKAQQDERTISAYLTFKYPDKYCFYKASFYNKYVKLIKEKQHDVNEKFIHYLSLVNAFIEDYVIKDKELLDIAKSYLDSNCYDDQNYKILAQDILFRGLDESNYLNTAPVKPASAVSKAVKATDDFRPKYWLYAPGKGAKYWDEFYDEGVMCIGWQQLGDLNQYATKQEIAKRLMQLDGTGSSKKNDATANDDFKNNISIGDIVIAKKGVTEYLGYGVVKSDYYYDDNRAYYKNCRKVDWKKKGGWKESGGQLVTKTLTDMTNYPEYVEKIKTLMGIEDEFEPKQTIPLSLNTILYGPPGTGKTYRLKNEFFNYFTDRRSVKSEAEHCEELVQVLSWWQVISIVMLDLKNAKVQEIFEHPLLQAKVRSSDNKTPKNTIWAWLQRHTKDECEHVNLKNRDNPQFFEKDGQSNWSIDESIAKIQTPDFYDVLEKYKNFQSKTESKRRYVFTTFHQSFSYEDFIEGIKPVLVKTNEDIEKQDISYHIEDGIFKTIVNKALKEPDKNYAIFIDEINRGNVANIFGELITLIEEDKRKGCENHLPAILPYSKSPFSVPPNLFIIGTMNTADRSVEALDNALRRRFSFIEMSPDPSILAQDGFVCENIDLEKMLYSINRRIEKLLDKDYCIGHSYFMNFNDRNNPLNDLKIIFSNKILPLLQEYFYGDWGKIMLVLGKGFIDKKVETVSFLSVEDFDDYEDYDEKPVYSIIPADNWSLDTFKTIYE